MRVVANNELAARRSVLEELEARLHHGDLIIRQLEAEDKPVDRLVEHWLTLLKEYEAEFRALQSAA